MERVANYVTNLIFKMEQLDENFVGSTWVETSARHDEAQSTSEIAYQQQAAERWQPGGPARRSDSQSEQTRGPQ